MNSKPACLDCGSEDLVLVEDNDSDSNKKYKCMNCHMELYGWEILKSPSCTKGEDSK